MPRAATKKPTLAALTADMSDDDELAYTQFGKGATEMPTPDSAAENKAAATKKRAPTRATTAAKPKAAPVKETTTKQRGKRAALEDLTNVGDDVEKAPAKKRAKTVPKAAPKTAPKSKVLKDAVDESLVADETQVPVPDLGQEAEEISESIEQVSPPPPQPQTSVHRLRQPTRAQSQSRPINRANSRALSTERSLGDAALRRRLGDLTSKHESLELKYTQLREVASVESQTSFDRLKLSMEKHSKSQDKLIASLRKQVAAQTDLVKEVRTLRAQIAASETENEKLKHARDMSTAEVKTLKDTSLKAQNEVKALQAKLAASRANTDSAQAKGKAALVNSSSGSALASLKEDLYCDVTGLLIHNVKKMDRRTVYDCSQTGRNGTLRFQFTIDEIDLSTMTPGASVFDDTQVTYTPLIDERNDQQLYDILPDYLLEEIEFPRSSMMKLYTSIRDGMTKAVVIQEDDDSSRDED